MILSIRMGRPEKDAALAAIDSRSSRSAAFNTYGYRRMWLVLKKQRHPPQSQNHPAYDGEIRSACLKSGGAGSGSTWDSKLHSYENLLNRQFHADRPNSKWVTDISYIHTKQGVLYLSMIRDLYDNSIVAYKTGTEQTVNLVLDTIRLAMRKEKKRVAAELQLHSDQGFQYTSQAYFKLTQTIRHYAFHVKTREIRMTMPWQKISSPSSKQSVFTDTNRLPSLRPTR